MNYTVIGDTVNVASRLEGANKQYGTQILIGAETKRLIGDALITREIDSIAVYGRTEGLGGLRIDRPQRPNQQPSVAGRLRRWSGQISAS